MKVVPLVLLVMLLLSTCQSTEQTTKHLFYLHPRIVELQGLPAVSEQFGPYEFQEILDTLNDMGVVMHAEIRTVQTDFQTFCEQVVEQVNELITNGVHPEDITVVGASKGAVMAMYIAHLNPHPVNYVLLGANTPQIEQENNWNLHGRILGIYDTSDALAGRNYNHWVARSTHATSFEQLEINTGLGHGFLYRPIADWVAPVRNWVTKE